MLRPVTTVAAALTLLTITGCTANPQEVSSTASPQATAATAAPEDSEQPEPTFAEMDMPDTDVEVDGPFAAEALEHLLATLTEISHLNVDNENYTDDCQVPFETLEEHQTCSPSDPIGYLDSIESPREGVLTVRLMPEAWGGGEYDPDRVFTVPYLAQMLHGYISSHSSGPLEVTTTTPDGEYQATHGKVPDPDPSDVPQTDAELEDWADARFEDWLRSMNFTYQGLCGGVESVADYRECVPDDPHGYITNVEAPSYGELVVHVDDGPWQGGQYEPAARFMSGNMALKIGRYSNELETLTVITEDGQTDTVNYDPQAGTYYY